MAEAAKQITDLGPEELAEVERIESELNTFIEKRAREAKDAENVTEQWAKSGREQRDKRRQENRHAWRAFHLHLADVNSELAAEHHAHARALLEEGSV